jgi:hypothetical protein
VKRTAIVLAVVGLIWVIIPLASATDSNQVGYWCETGVKYEPVDTPYVVPEPPADSAWTLLVLKAGSGEGSNHVVENPVVGQAYTHPNDKNISHVILCYEGENGTTTTGPPVTVATTTTTNPSDTTTTTDPTTTTTVPETSTTTTSSTTTSTTQPTTTTSTTEPTTTSTTESPSTTTTLGTTTTTVVATTTTDPPVTTTTAGPDELPYTGLEMAEWFALAVLLIGVGSLLLAGTWRAFASGR